MVTKREEMLENTLKESGLEWEAIVRGRVGNTVLDTKFNSKFNTLDELAHKIKLDCIVNILHDLPSPIAVKIWRTNRTERIKTEAM